MTGTQTYQIPASPRSGSSFLRKLCRVLAATFIGFVLLLLNLWAVAAIYVDCRILSLRVVFAAIYIVALIFLVAKAGRHRALCCLLCFCVVLGWWLSLKPSDDGNWRPDVARTAWAETAGDRITVHNVRNCDYHSETEYSDCWSDRTYNLSDLRAADFFFVNWGVRWIGHPIVSFDFGDNQHLAFSIEARYKPGQTYSAILGFFRQYELIFIAADERDVIRLRTNYRKDEEVYMYRTNAPPDVVRKFFLTYVTYLNHLREHPEWYNAVTKNCTTTLDSKLSEDLPKPKAWSYKLLLNGTLDELLYERGRLVTDGLPFVELKQREHINPFARTVGQSPDFSALIRAGRVGF
ncbi:DUF4105 domain-containing protein [Tunturiibacter gelidoferens]|uniref:Lnb N-terminal periplasmic domain-containing protein n=1 Tax=Tunturiibacter lichenicola TaxID=2051959 RepID=A0A7Y9TC03_9BACT|nr:DUF4105 domain-containing protein [Edaphobacter lichenicola]NYF53625.1 hypothetical protein [Edaphobacter lichenicola]